MILEIERFINSREIALDFCDASAGKKITYRQSGYYMEGILLGTHEHRSFPRALVRSKTGKEYYVFIENLISIEA